MKKFTPVRWLLLAMLVSYGLGAKAQQNDEAPPVEQPVKGKAGKGRAGKAAKSDDTGSASRDGKAEEPKEGKIVGVPIDRGNGKWLGVTIENGGFRLNFYDEKKKPIKVDVARATARWNPPQKQGQATAILLPNSDGIALVSSKFVQPPRTFKLFLTLLSEAGDVLATHVVDFRETKE